MINYDKMKLAIDRYAKDYMYLEKVYQKSDRNADVQRVLNLAQDKVEDNLKVVWGEFCAEIAEEKTKPLVEILDWIQKHPELIEYKDGKVYYKPDGSIMVNNDECNS